MALRAADIIILGTMKGGTTNLFNLMRKHPAITIGQKKEIHYFTMHFAKTIDWYKEQFPDRDEQTLALDASPTYFDLANSTEIPLRIKSAIPDAKLILCVRDPIERSISHFYHLQKWNVTKPYFENLSINEFFEQALTGGWDRRNPYGIHTKFTLDFSIYEHKYRHYIASFGAERILVLDNDQIIQDQRAAMQKAFRHCGIEDLSENVVIAKSYELQKRAGELDDGIRARMEELLYPHFEDFKRVAAFTS